MNSHRQKLSSHKLSKKINNPPPPDPEPAPKQSFTRFPNVPSEPRLEIWKMQFPGPRLITVTRTFKTMTKDPSILYVNHEARQVACSRYLVVLKHISMCGGSRPIRIDPDIDTVFLTHPKIPSILPEFLESEIGLIAFNCDENISALEVAEPLYSFKSLRQVNLVPHGRGCAVPREKRKEGICRFKHHSDHRLLEFRRRL